MDNDNGCCVDRRCIGETCAYEYASRWFNPSQCTFTKIKTIYEKLQSYLLSTKIDRKLKTIPLLHFVTICGGDVNCVQNVVQCVVIYREVVRISSQL